MSMLEISANKSFNGWLNRFDHSSKVLNCQMKFSIFLPPQASETNRVPVVYFLSGLTCTDENFMQKAGALRIAAKLGIAIVTPDTSPRGDDVADDDGYDLGMGAGFYLNAVQKPWSNHYHMYDYVVTELPALIEKHFPISDKRAIMGHSMGGHGALVMGLRNPDFYQSISAFSPICNPTQCQWGQKAFSAYLGDDRETWKAYDASLLMATSMTKTPILIEQGLGDEFLVEQLKPQNLINVAVERGYPLELGEHNGYDHSYYFIASFIEKHLCFHHKHLNL